MVKPVRKFETRGVLAGAYRGKDVAERELLTHAVEVGLESEKSLCRGVKADHFVDAGGMDGDEIRATPSCARCAEKLAKLIVAGKAVHS